MASASKLNRTLRDFIENQPLFFVATAARDGQVNVSPKGCNSLKVIDDNNLVWINLSGSGNETAAHLLDTNRMTLMFCAFNGEARILRVYGTANTYHPRDKKWSSLAQHFEVFAGSRQIFDMTIDLVQTSCGTGVPFMDYKAPRADTELLPFYKDIGEDGVSDYWKCKNTKSIDGKSTGILE